MPKSAKTTANTTIHGPARRHPTNRLLRDMSVGFIVEFLRRRSHLSQHGDANRRRGFRGSALFVSPSTAEPALSRFRSDKGDAQHRISEEKIQTHRGPAPD